MTLHKTDARFSAESLVVEIQETLLQSRLLHEQQQSEKQDRPSCASERTEHERTVMLDVTIALLIRHRLPIDTDAAATAVCRAQERAAGQPDEMKTWAGECANHIILINQGTGS